MHILQKHPGFQRLARVRRDLQQSRRNLPAAICGGRPFSCSVDASTPLTCSETSHDLRVLDRQPVDRKFALPGAEGLAHEQHGPGLGIVAGNNSVQVWAGCLCHAVRIPSIPDKSMASRILQTAFHGTDQPAQKIEHMD